MFTTPPRPLSPHHQHHTHHTDEHKYNAAAANSHVVVSALPPAPRCSRGVATIFLQRTIVVSRPSCMLPFLRLAPHWRKSSIRLICRLGLMASECWTSAGGENRILCMKARAEIDARTVSSMIGRQNVFGTSKRGSPQPIY